MDPRSRWSKLMHARWWNRSLRTEIKTLSTQYWLPWRHSLMMTMIALAKIDKCGEVRKVTSTWFTTNSGRLEYRVQLDVSCLPPHGLPAHTIIYWVRRSMSMSFITGREILEILQVHQFSTSPRRDISFKRYCQHEQEMSLLSPQQGRKSWAHTRWLL